MLKYRPENALFVKTKKRSAVLRYLFAFRLTPDWWENRIRYKDRKSNKYKEKSKRGFKTKKEAQLSATQVEMEIGYYHFMRMAAKVLTPILKVGWKYI
ncbi:Arm DNA-binding domain-containing protein [Bacillus swezeyi]|uniref:Arm DNA-binding domain-containing protein n=1 Tax=Bacillus swezeyi TaxID=1925020 RepID=UPI0027DC2B61|nr:Arm DNA-binding domain-containing protein [Bacillus swezeyi]